MAIQTAMRQPRRCETCGAELTPLRDGIAAWECWDCWETRNFGGVVPDEVVIAQGQEMVAEQTTVVVTSTANTEIVWDVMASFRWMLKVTAWLAEIGVSFAEDATDSIGDALVTSPAWRGFV